MLPLRNTRAAARTCSSALDRQVTGSTPEGRDPHKAMHKVHMQQCGPTYMSVAVDKQGA